MYLVLKCESLYFVTRELPFESVSIVERLLGLFFFQQWNDLDAPEAAIFPGKYEGTLTDFQRLLLLRCFRVDRVYLAITNFVTGRMGEKYVTPPVISFEAIFEQSTPISPIIFILSPGSDPASDLMKLAERSGFGGNKLKFLAMGQGQEKVRRTSYWGNWQSTVASDRFVFC